MGRDRQRSRRPCRQNGAVSDEQRRAETAGQIEHTYDFAKRKGIEHPESAFGASCNSNDFDCGGAGNGKSMDDFNSDIDFINQVYDIVLDRSPDVPGAEYYYEKLTEDGATRSSIVHNMLNSAENKQQEGRAVSQAAIQAELDAQKERAQVVAQAELDFIACLLNGGGGCDI